MNHKSKVKIARRLLTREEREGNTSVFDSVGWKTRKEAIAERVRSQQGEAHEQALERQKKWAKNYDFCVECRTTDRPHHAEGMCRVCWDKKRGTARGYKYLAQNQKTVHFSCEVCKTSIDSGIDSKTIDKELTLFHQKCREHQYMHEREL